MSKNKSIIPVIESEKINYNNNHLFPNIYRCLVVGESGNVKTVLINRLLLTNMLQFDILYIYSPSIRQKEYEIFIKGINNGLELQHILGLYNEQNKIKNFDYAIELLSKQLKTIQSKKVIGNDDPSKIIKPEDMSTESLKEFKTLPINKNKTEVNKPRTIVLIDDAICSKQNAINKMFVYSRTFNINVIYLTQAFFATDKNMTRTNVNLFILYRQNQDDCQRIYKRVNKSKLTFEEFYSFANTCWSKNRGFIIIKTDPILGTTYYDGEEIVKEIDKLQQQLYPV